MACYNQLKIPGITRDYIPPFQELERNEVLLVIRPQPQQLSTTLVSVITCLSIGIFAGMLIAHYSDKNLDNRDYNQNENAGYIEGFLCALFSQFIKKNN